MVKPLGTTGAAGTGSDIDAAYSQVGILAIPLVEACHAGVHLRSEHLQTI